MLAVAAMDNSVMTHQHSKGTVFTSSYHTIRAIEKYLCRFPLIALVPRDTKNNLRVQVNNESANRLSKHIIEKLQTFLS